MKLVYVDESFDRDEYWVTGLVVPSERAIELGSALDSIVADAARAYPVEPEAELHAHDLTHGKADWVGMAPMLRARLGILGDCLDAIRSVSGVRAFLYGLDRQRHRRKYVNPFPEMQVLLGHVAQRVHGLCSAECPLLLMADDADQKQRIREHIAKFKREGTFSRINSTPLRHIADTVYFAPSSSSRLIQAADLVSYMHFRWHRKPSSDARAIASAEQLWKRVSPVCNTNMWEQ